MATLPTSLAYEILTFLRDRLLSAAQANDRKLLLDLQATFDVLLEFAYKVDDRGMGRILETLESSARDVITGIPGKASYPTDEEILSAGMTKPEA